ncbi:MAG: hypothetical protein AB8C46_09400 [Burkholderiaceae bacterium]
MKHLQMKTLLTVASFGLAVLLASCATPPPSTQQLTPFKTLTLDRTRARVGRAAIMAVVRPSAADEPASASVRITRIGGKAVATDIHSVILDAVPHSIGVSVDAGPERFFSLPLKIDKRYLIIAHRFTDNTRQPATESLDLWVEQADTGEVVYGGRSGTTESAMQTPAFMQSLERHRAHLLSLFVDAS